MEREMPQLLTDTFRAGFAVVAMGNTGLINAAMNVLRADIKKGIVEWREVATDKFEFRDLRKDEEWHVVPSLETVPVAVVHQINKRLKAALEGIDKRRPLS